jgi:hypothetical protein
MYVCMCVCVCVYICILQPLIVALYSYQAPPPLVLCEFIVRNDSSARKYPTRNENICQKGYNFQFLKTKQTQL